MLVGPNAVTSPVGDSARMMDTDGRRPASGRMAAGKVRAVIFDTDGVIIATASIHEDAWRAVFDDFLAGRPSSEREDHTPFTSEDYRRYVDGRARADGVATFLASRAVVLEQGTPDDDPARDTVWGVGNRKNERFLSLVRQQGVTAYPSTVALLGQLRARRIATAAVSASENARAMLTAAGVDDLFDTCVDGRDARALRLAGKPDPALFLEAAGRLGVTPGESIVVEDAVAGVEAGRRGGFGLVVGVDRRGSPGDLADRGADVVVPDLSEFDIDARGRWRARLTRGASS